jgi:hypothetical protein
VIFTETDPQTAGTLFSNMKELGVLGIPVLGGSENNTPQYFADVAHVVGGYAAESKFMDIAEFAVPKTPGLAYMQQQWSKAFPGKPAATTPSENLYDSANIVALAMVAAHSTNPAVFVNDIAKVTNDTSGTRVTNFAQGVRALKAGKSIYYDGAVGEYLFNKYHWVLDGYDLYRLTSTDKLTPVSSLSGQQVANLLNKLRRELVPEPRCADRGSRTCGSRTCPGYDARETWALLPSGQSDRSVSRQCSPRC